jgi:uncharacterized protein
MADIASLFSHHVPTPAHILASSERRNDARRFVGRRRGAAVRRGGCRPRSGGGGRLLRRERGLDPPGRSAIAGEHRGWDAIRDDFLAKVGPISGGTIRAELTEVAVGDEHVVAVQHATAEHRRRRLDITACQLMRIEDGKIVHVRGHYSDQYALDDFWS